jgi:hypothetical protein
MIAKEIFWKNMRDGVANINSILTEPIDNTSLAKILAFAKLHYRYSDLIVKKANHTAKLNVRLPPL